MIFFRNYSESLVKCPHFSPVKRLSRLSIDLSILLKLRLLPLYLSVPVRRIHHLSETESVYKDTGKIPVFLVYYSITFDETEMVRIPVRCCQNDVWSVDVFRYNTGK